MTVANITVLYDGTTPYTTLPDWLLLSFAFCTNVFQLVIIGLIWRRSPDTISEYRLYLCGMTFSDFLFNLAIAFLIEQKVMRPSIAHCFSTGMANYLTPRGRAAFAVAMFAISCQIQFQMLSTIYRFASVKSMEHTKLYLLLQKRRFKVSILVVVTAMAAMVGCISYLSAGSAYLLVGWRLEGYQTPVNTKKVIATSLLGVVTGILNGTNILAQMPNGSLNSTNFDLTTQTPTTTTSTIGVGSFFEHFAEPIKLSASCVNHVLGANTTASGTMMTIVKNIAINYFDGLKPFVQVMCSIYFCIIAVVETVCFVFGLSLIRYLRKNKHCFSAQTYNMQLQLISLLVIQVVELFLLIFTPIIFMLLISVELQYFVDRDTMLHLTSTTTAQMFVLCLILFSFINALITLIFVRPYRRAFASFWTQICCHFPLKYIKKPQNSNNIVHPIVSSSNQLV